MILLTSSSSSISPSPFGCPNDFLKICSVVVTQHDLVSNMVSIVQFFFFYDSIG